MSSSTPLSSLAPGAKTITKTTTTSNIPSTGNVHIEGNVPVTSQGKSGHQGYNWAWAIIVFIILVIIIWLILWAVKPTWVQQTDPAGNCTGEIDNGKALLWAVVIAIVICVIIWLVRAAAYAGRTC